MIDVFQLTIKNINDLLFLNTCIYKKPKLLYILKNLKISEYDYKKIAIYINVIYAIEQDDEKKKHIFLKFTERQQKLLIIFVFNSCININDNDKDNFNAVLSDYLFEESQSVTEYEYIKESQYLKKIYKNGRIPEIIIIYLYYNNKKKKNNDIIFLYF